MHLILKILRKVETIPAGQDAADYLFEPFHGHSEEEGYEHISLLIDAGYLQGRYSKSDMNMIKSISVSGLTWAGHDFLELCSNEHILEEVICEINKVGAGFTLNLLSEFLTFRIKKAIVI
jgi:hypothetical protein